MSLQAAVSELNDEIAKLTKEGVRINREIERVAQIRDRLLPNATAASAPGAKQDKAAKKPTAKKKSIAAATHKTRSAKTASAPAPKRRTMSAEARKRISDGSKKRWAAIRKEKETQKAS
jgi:hypothetical protein